MIYIYLVKQTGEKVDTSKILQKFELCKSLTKLFFFALNHAFKIIPRSFANFCR